MELAQPSFSAELPRPLMLTTSIIIITTRNTTIQPSNIYVLEGASGLVLSQLPTDSLAILMTDDRPILSRADKTWI